MYNLPVRVSRSATLARRTVAVVFRTPCVTEPLDKDGFIVKYPRDGGMRVEL